MNRNFILDANSSHAFDVNSGFQSHDVARANFLFLASAEPRPFVNLNSQAVAGAMHEIRPKAMLIEKAPRGPVNASGGYAGAKSLDALPPGPARPLYTTAEFEPARAPEKRCASGHCSSGGV